MDYLDYREKLGIGFNDDLKFRYFKTKLFNVLYDICSDVHSGCLDCDEYSCFCNSTGTEINHRLTENYTAAERMRHCVCVLEKHTSYLTEFLPYCMAFINSVKTEKYGDWKRNDFVSLVTSMMKQSHILYDLLEENGEFFIFPKGAPELDTALVSEPLEWLIEYPLAHRTYVTALKQYADGIYVRDVADNLRKALEAFLQEFLGNNKNLESNKNDICRYLGEQGVDSGITSLFHPLINAYKNINDRIAKHNDAVDGKLLEFLLYQTGVLIRLVLTVKQADTEIINDAN